VSTKVQRTLVKSEPELQALIEADPRLRDAAVDVSMAEKGFGTRVTLVVDSGAGLDQAALEDILDRLAEPQKRPFSGT
jgi:hypothetical protein